MMKYLIVSLAISLLFLSSCSTSRRVLYFQDLPAGENRFATGTPDIVIMPKDRVSIVVSGRDAGLAAPFNLSRVSYQAGTLRLGGSANNEELGYTVDAKGFIDFPILGAVRAKGLTREQLSATIKGRLEGDGLLKDPVVTVAFMNLGVSVLGEVKAPGRYSIERDRINILEVISMAGDLTIYGKRDGIVVIREKDDGLVTYKMDLRSAGMFSSPAYHLQQNDIVYVEPNSVRAGQATINGNNVKSVSLWMSLTSLVVTLGILIFK